MRRPFVQLLLRPSALSLALALALVAGCSRPPPAGPGAVLPTATVQTAAVRQETVVLVRELGGTVRAVNEATVSSRVMATVVRADAVIGRAVRAGEVLVTLSAKEIEARVEQAKAALSQAERDHAREAALLGKGAATADAVSSLADRLRAARAGLSEAETMLSYTHVAAPFDGVITRDHVNPGDLAVPGAPLFALEAPRPLRVEVEVPESLPALAIGTAAEVRLSEGVPTTTARLAEFSPAANPVSRTRLAKLDLADSASARTGQFVRVAWPAGETTVLTTPDTALAPFGQMERVFVVREGRAELRLVTTGKRDGGRVQLLSGVGAGEVVVVAPPASLRDGQPVEVKP
jgi:RND family efflux transporter MFP subunit